MRLREILFGPPQPGDCKHLQKFLRTEDPVRLSTLFPHLANDPDNDTLIKGLRIQECLRCGQILSANYSTDEKPPAAQTSEYPLATKELAESANFHASIPRFDLGEVVLGQTTRGQLDQMRAKMEYAKLFYIDYNFQKVRPYGKATVALFYGPSGTGKTRCAEALARSLGLGFLDVNISELESRFMSQTGKNITKAFECATAENALLFFDEADTVLGKRLTTVTQGVDAEINVARTQMLKELEEFTGVCVFATNFESNIDKAFVRRIGYKVHFPLPDPETLERLWRYFLLDTLPFEDDKNAWIPELAALSGGLSGADIVLAIELSFPKAILENKETPLIRKNFLLESIAEVREAKEKIGVETQGADPMATLISLMYNLKQQ